jgi:heptaprenyl diphosphate synthase
MKLRKMVFLGIMIAIGIVVSIVEAQISAVLFLIPGVKLGLANIVTLIILYLYGERDAFIVLMIRILLVAILYSAMPAPLMSFAGGITAFVGMILLKKVRSLSMISVSVTGSFLHMVGQIVMAIIVLNTEALILYLPYMMVLSVPTGIFTGIVAKKLTEVFQKTQANPES